MGDRGSEFWVNVHGRLPHEQAPQVVWVGLAAFRLPGERGEGKSILKRLLFEHQEVEHKLPRR